MSDGGSEDVERSVAVIVQDGFLPRPVLRPVIHFGLATTMQVIYAVVAGGHPFYLRVSEVE